MTQLRADVARFLNDRLDWNLLRTFLVIMQERSVSRAAARLHLTQPAVSQALKRLEDTLGRNLIQRRGPHFEPTRAGEEVYRIASDIYGHMSRLETELDDRTDDITGSIRLLSVSRIDSAVYDEFLAEFHRDVSAHRFAYRGDALVGHHLVAAAKDGDGGARPVPHARRQARATLLPAPALRDFLRAASSAVRAAGAHDGRPARRRISCRSRATRSATVFRR